MLYYCSTFLFGGASLFNFSLTKKKDNHIGCNAASNGNLQAINVNLPDAAALLRSVITHDPYGRQVGSQV